MTTFSHGFWTYLLVRKKASLWYMLLGAVFSDFIFIFGTLWLVLFNGNYSWAFLSSYHMVILNTLLAIPIIEILNTTLHSLPVWLALLLIAFISKKTFFPFVVGWGIHLWQDILTHVTDSDLIFWPISTIKVSSFFSYWDENFYGAYFEIINWTVIMGTITIFIWKKLRNT